MLRVILFIALVIAVVAGAVFFYFEAERQKRETEALRSLVTPQATETPQEEIFISADECRTTDGLNSVAFCSNQSRDKSVFLDSGADAAVKICFEHTAKKLNRPIADAQAIACEVAQAYQSRNYSYDSDADHFGIQNTNYNILNEWVNR